MGSTRNMTGHSFSNINEKSNEVSTSHPTPLTQDVPTSKPANVFSASNSRATPYELQPVVRCEDEEAGLVVLGRAHDGHRLGEHHLVGEVRVQVHRAQEGRLGGVGVDLDRVQQKC